jgi:hypothetical protein
MAYPGFGHLWQQTDMSDVEIVLSCEEEPDPRNYPYAEAQSSNKVVLQQFPGHSQILSLCPYFVAQVGSVSLHLILTHASFNPRPVLHN